MADKDKPEGVAGAEVVVNHGGAIVPDINVHRLVDMNREDGVEFPVDADAGTKKGGTAVGIRENTDK